MNVNISVEQETLELLQKLAILKNIPETEYLKNMVLEAWEDQQDYADAVQSMQEYEKNPISFDLADVGRELAFEV